MREKLAVEATFVVAVVIVFFNSLTIQQNKVSDGALL